MATKTLGKIDFLQRWHELRGEVEGDDIEYVPDNLMVSGLDLAERIDHSAMFMLLWDGRYLNEHGTAVWPHVNYSDIANDVRDINEKMPQHKIAYDETGNIGVGQLFSQDMDAVLEPIHMTNPMKVDAVRVVKFLSQLGILRLEPNSPVIREIEEQQKVISDAGFERYEHPSGSHDDLFWGLALACYVAVDFIIGVAPAAIENSFEASNEGEDAETIIEGVMQHAKWHFQG